MSLMKKDEAIEKLNLRDSASKAAYILKEKHPTVEFTSGRRDKQAQARAMASNVLKNRTWIEQTYIKHEVSIACQKWVDDHPEAVTQAQLEAGLMEALNTFTEEEIRKISWHLSGDAFDVKPVQENAEQIKADIRALPNLNKFLEKEGGLERWHAQFLNMEEPFDFQTPTSVA